MIDNVVFFFAPDSEYKGMDPQELKGIADAFRRQMVETLKPGYPIVQKPAPDAVRLRFAITDLRQNRPVLSDVASEGPIGLSESATGHVVVRDGCDRRGDAYVRLDDRRGGRGRQGREGHRAERKVHQWGSAEDAFQFWADRLKAFLDQAHAH